MKKFLALVILFSGMPVFAEVTNVEPTAAPNQEISNTKSYTGINYNRQDTTQTGTQKIVNDHSWFNINIQILKEGALFKKNTNGDAEI